MSFQRIRPSLKPCVTFRNMLVIFYGELSFCPTAKVRDHPLSAVCDCLFGIFAATFNMRRSSPPTASWGRAMPWWQGTHLTWTHLPKFNINVFLPFPPGSSKWTLVKWIPLERKYVLSRSIKIGVLFCIKELLYLGPSLSIYIKYENTWNKI
jgi:hypothetical protein